MKEKDKYNFLVSRKQVMKNIFSGFIVGIILSLFCDSWLVVFPKSAHHIFWVSFVLMAVIIIYIFVSGILPFIKREETINSSIVYNKKRKQLIPLNGYWFSEKIVDYINSVQVENKTAEKMWESSSLTPNKITNCFLMVGEAVTYFIFSLMSVSLNDYFSDVQNTEVKRYKYKDFSGKDWNNLFFKTIAKPMTGRPAFKDGYKVLLEAGGVPQITRAPNGALFEHFELPLPANASISRNPADGAIKIRTQQLEFSVKSTISISNYYVPYDFIENFISKDNYDDIRNITCLEVNVHVKLCPNVFKMIFSPKMEDYLWVDKIMQVLENNISEDKFLAKLKWKDNEYLFDRISKLEDLLKKLEHKAANTEINAALKSASESVGGTDDAKSPQ